MTFNSNLKEKTGTPVRDLGEGCVTTAHMFTQRDIEQQEIKEKRGRGGRGGGGRVALALILSSSEPMAGAGCVLRGQTFSDWDWQF